MYMYILSERWLIHLSGGYSRPVLTSVGRTLDSATQGRVSPTTISLWSGRHGILLQHFLTSTLALISKVGVV